MKREAPGFGRRALGALIGALALFACAENGVARPPAAPVIASGLDAVPADLDHVIRLDLERLRAALGAPLFEWIETVLFDHSGGDEVDRLVARALFDSRVVVIGLRVGEANAADLVAVLEGPFASFDPRSGPTGTLFGGPVNLGGGFQRYDRLRAGERGDAAVFYLRPPDLLVIGSVAEIDAVEAVIERGSSPTPLRPKASGLASFKARLSRLPYRRALRASSLASFVDRASTLEGSLDVRGDELSLELVLELDSQASAQGAAEVSEELRRALSAGRGRVARIAERTSVTASDAALVLRATLPVPEFLKMVAEKG